VNREHIESIVEIYLDDDVPEQHRGDIERNARFFRR
jgi:hypothetical protein